MFFWSFIVALVLFSLGGLFSLYEGWHKLTHPEPLSYAWVAVGILVFGLVAETISLRACLHEVNKVRGKRTLWRWFRESRQSELVVILGEDFAALLGLALALIAVLMTMLTGNPMWDAPRLDVDRRGADRRRDRHRHRDQGAAHRPERRARDRGAPARVPAAAGRRGEGLPPDHPAARHLADGRGEGEDEGRQRATELVAAINRAEAATRAEFPEIQWLFFEPDMAD